MQTQLEKHFENLENGHHPTFLDLMEMISDVAMTVTLDERPAGDSELITICELNGHVCSQ